MSISRGKVTIHVENNITKLIEFIDGTPDKKIRIHLRNS